MPEPERDPLAQVREYQRMVEAHEALDRRIDALIAAGRGRAQPTSAEEWRQYRGMGARGEWRNDMRRLEERLNLSENDALGASEGRVDDHRSHV